MSLEALRACSCSRAVCRRFQRYRRRYGLAVWFGGVLALSTSSCLSNPTAPLPLLPAYLQFTVEPPVYSTVGRPLSSPVQVSVVDATGRTLTDFSTAVTVELGGNPYDATLSGRTSVLTSGGVATFSDLSVDRLGTYYLIATSGNLPQAGSAPFEIAIGSATAGAQVVGGNAIH